MTWKLAFPERTWKLVQVEATRRGCERRYRGTGSGHLEDSETRKKWALAQPKTEAMRESGRPIHSRKRAETDPRLTRLVVPRDQRPR